MLKQTVSPEVLCARIRDQHSEIAPLQRSRNAARQIDLEEEFDAMLRAGPQLAPVVFEVLGREGFGSGGRASARAKYDARIRAMRDHYDAQGDLFGVPTEKLKADLSVVEFEVDGVRLTKEEFLADIETAQAVLDGISHDLYGLEEKIAVLQGRRDKTAEDVMILAELIARMAAGKG